MTLAVDWEIKHQLKQTNKQISFRRTLNGILVMSIKAVCAQFVRERPYAFFIGGGGGRLEDVFGPGYFFTRDAVLSFYLYIIQYVL